MAKKPTTDKPPTDIKKTACPVTRDEFLKGAKPLSVVINGIPMAASVKEFSTGSFGYYLTGKSTVDVGGIPVTIQIGMNIIAVGSKEAK